MWNPDHKVCYTGGKYPVYELVKARQTLIHELRNTQSEVLERLKPKIGIPSRYGPPMKFLPPVQPPTQQIGRLGGEMSTMQSPTKPPYERPDGAMLRALYQPNQQIAGDSETFFSSEDEVVLKKRRLSKKESIATSTVVREEPRAATEQSEPKAGTKKATPTVKFAASETAAPTTESLSSTQNETEKSPATPNAERIREDSRSSDKSLDDMSVIEVEQPAKPVVDLTEDEETQDSTDVVKKLSVKDDAETRDFVEIFARDDEENHLMGGARNSKEELIEILDDDEVTEGKTDDVVNRFSIGDEHNDVTLREELVEILKCDFCEFKTKDVNYEEMEAHLDSSKHYTASRYFARKCKGKDGDELEVVYVDKKLEITKVQNKYESFVVLCPDPECSDVFEDTFMCSEHHKLCHGSVRGQYSLCPVVYRCLITLHNTPFCQSCREAFDSHRDLHSHWTDMPQHHPVTRAVPPNTLPLYICPYCDMTFVKNFFSCKTHILIHATRKANNSRALSGMKVRYVQKSQKAEEAPLTEAEVKGGGSALKDSIDNLQRMNKHFQKVGMTNMKRKRISEEIRNLQNHMSPR